MNGAPGWWARSRFNKTSGHIRLILVFTGLILVLFPVGQARSAQSDVSARFAAIACEQTLKGIDGIFLSLEARPGPPPFVEKLITNLIKQAKNLQKEIDRSLSQEDLSSFERELLKLARDLVLRIINLLESLKELIQGQMRGNLKGAFLKSRSEALESLRRLKSLKPGTQTISAFSQWIIDSAQAGYTIRNSSFRKVNQLGFPSNFRDNG